MTAPAHNRPPTFRAPSERSLSLLLQLAGERSVPEWGADAVARVEAARQWLAEADPDQRAVSLKIDQLMGRSRDVSADTGASGRALEPGVYEVDGVVYVVKPNRAKTGLYAKRLVEIGGRRLSEDGGRVRIEFVYAPGAVQLILPEHRMPADRARTLTLVYGRCLNCGRRLKDAESVERGIGPVCAKAFA